MDRGGDDLSRSSKIIALALVLQIVPAFGQENVASQINALPVGTRIELRLNNKHRVRGARGKSSNTGFTLVDDRTGERQIAFDDVVSVRRFQPHPVRNTLIVVGIVLVALGIVGSRV